MFLSNAQLVLFFSPFEPTNIDGISWMVKRDIKKIFNEDLNNQNFFNMFPAEAPAEIPRLQIATSNQQIRFGASLVRSDFTIEHPMTSTEVDLSKFWDAVRVINKAFDSVEVPALRAGVIFSYVLQMPNVDEIMSSSLLNPKITEMTKNIKDVNISINSVSELDGTEVNNVTSFSSALNLDDQQKFILIQKDINFLISPEIVKDELFEKVKAHCELNVKKDLLEYYFK